MVMKRKAYLTPQLYSAKLESTPLLVLSGTDNTSAGFYDEVVDHKDDDTHRGWQW